MAANPVEVNLLSLLSALESKTAKLDDKIEAFNNFNNNLNEGDLSLFTEDVGKEKKRVLAVARRDALADNDKLSQQALQVLGFCLHDVEISRSLAAGEVTEIVAEICSIIRQTKDKTTCTRALWCLSRQSLPVYHLSEQVGSILTAIGEAMDKWKGQSNTVEFEAVNTIARLQAQMSCDMEASVGRYLKLVFPLLSHNAVKIRELSLEVMEMAADQITDENGVEFRQALMADLKGGKWLGELKKLFQTKNETYILTVWSLLVRLLGKELHHGSFINNILSVPEMGFKSTSATVKCAAFDAWRHLIDNFGLNPVIIGDAKRVKLIMQVFKINNAKVESVAEKKLSVWWHFIQKLDSKISMYFDQVCVPLLQMCVGGPKLAGSANQTMATPTFSRAVPGKLAVGASPVTPRLGLPNSSTNTPVFPAIQLQGCQILAHILGAIPVDIDIPRVHFSVPPLRVEVMTGPAFFVKQSTIILSCAKELLAAQGKHIQDGLLYHIWYALVAHVKNVVESGAKSESRDVLTTFLGHFQLLVITEVMEYARLLKLFEAVVCLPRKALCSTAYQMGAGEVLHGTPVLFLTELLLTPKLLEACSASEKYMSLLSMLIEIGVSHGGVLEFSQVILHTLARHAEFTESDQLWRMWSTVVSQLLEHIKKTNEVNQGDVLEHDFTCMYAALMFPLKHLLTCRLSQPTTKTLLKTWTELYTTFSRLSSMVTNAEANVSCEQLCHQILAAVDFDTIQEVSFLDALTSMMEVVAGQVDFSSLGAPKPFSAHLSPSRWMKRKQRPLENIHSLVMLVSRTIECLQTLAGAVSNNSKTKSLTMTTIQATVSCILGVLTVLFTHVTTSHIIASMIEKLAQPMAEIYQSPSFRSFPATFQQKLERLWLDIATCLQSRYTGGFDSDFLSQLSPLLEATFSHPRRQIKTQAVMLWNATFSKSPPLRYPESLRPVLLRVKEKTPLLLPGWISTDIPVVEETPVSQFSQAGCSAPEARLPGMPSPHKIRGSFLNKAVSPNIKKSPARVVSPKAEGKSPAHSKAKKNLSLFDMRDEEFVVISASPKQKRVLTEHQKEVLKERKSLPAMYNNLELSQDVSLSSQFMTDTQPEKLSLSDSVIVLDSESQKMAPPPPVTSNQVEKSEEHPPPVKRRRSIRFSDEVFEKPSSAENKTQEHMQMSNCTLPGKSKSDTSKNDANSLNKSKDTTSVGVETPIVSFANQIKSSSSSQESVLSVKGNLQHAMGGLLSDISSSSFEKLAGSLGSEKNEIPSTKDPLKGVSAEWGKSSGSSTRNSSLSQLFSCPDDSVPHTSLNSVNMDSLVEDTQEMFSPPKSEPEPLVKDSVMETPVKSVDESIVFSGTPASRALFDRQASNGAENNEVFDSHVDPSGRVSPVVKIQRLSGEAIRRYSPSRSQSTEDDDKVRSQLVQSDSKPARVRRSLSHPESGKFGGELQSMVSDVGSLGSPIELSGQQSVPESPDSQSSQGFVPGDLAPEGSANSSQGGEGLPEQPEELMDETGDMTLRENIKDLCSESFLTSSQASIPNLGASTLKNSTELFSEISAVEASANESSETPSQIHSMASSNGSQDDQQSYNPELQSTMISSSEIKTRRKSYTAPKAAETTQDKKSRRKSLPNGQPAKAEQELSGMRTRHANKSESEKVELSQTLRRGRSGEQNVDHVTPANNKGDKKSSDSTDVGRKTRSSCVGIVENADGKNEEESSQDKIDKTLKKTEKSKEVIKTRNSCLKAIEQTVGNCEESSQDRIDNKTPKHQKPSKAISKSTANNSASTPGRGVKRPRKTRGSKAESSIHDTEVKDSLSSDEDEITFNFPNKVLKSDGNTNTADNIRLVEIPPDKTPDSREIVHKEPVRLSTSLVKKEQSKSTGSTPRSNTPKARKSLTAADPFGSDSDENLPLSNYASQESSKTNTLVDPVTEDLPSEKCEKEGKSDDKTIEASEVLTDGVNGGSSLEGSSEKELPSTPSRGPPKYKVAKSSPMSKRLRSAQKSDKPEPTENTASPRSATKGRRLSLTRKKLDVCGGDEPQQSSEEGKEKSLSESGQFTAEKQPEETVCEKMLCESDENITELESEKQGPSTKLSVEDVKENVPTNPVSEENKQNDDGNFTEIKSLDKKSNRVRFAEGELLEQVQSDDVLSTPKSAAPADSLCQSDSKLHGPKRLSFPLSDREACKTSPRGILKRRSLGKTASNILPRTRGFYSPWSSRGLHPGRRIHPITTARACSPSASPSASILKRRRLSGDVATNSPSPPSKQRRVSFADPVSVAKEMSSSESQGSDLMSGKGQVQVNRCLNLPAPICPVVSQNKKSVLSQSESSCGSTQESQLGCTGPVYPQLQQCSKPVETVLPQLTSSIWSRGLEQLVRSRNIRTVGDLCTLSEYEVHNLPIRSPKVPTLRRVLRQFESRSEKRVTGGVSSGISSLITAPTKTLQQSSVESYTPPGSPTKAAVMETPSSLPSQSLLTTKDRLPAIEENAGAEGVTEDGEEEALPAVEDALSQLSPVKDDGDLNASTDDETEVTESEKSVIPNQQPVVNATVSSDQTNSADVNQSNFLKTIEECSVRFTSEEIQRFGARDIFRLHSHLTTLLNAAVKALGPKCGSPESQ